MSSQKVCSFEGCEKRHEAKGLCGGHYYQAYRGQELRPLRKKASKYHVPRLCSLEGCQEKHLALDYCQAHYAILHWYNVSPEQWIALLTGQNKRCAICLRGDPGPRGWQLDHDHSCCSGRKSCGKCVRQILCSNCNVGLGQFQDDPNLLKAAILYLEKHSGKVQGTDSADA